MRRRQPPHPCQEIEERNSFERRQRRARPPGAGRLRERRAAVIGVHAALRVHCEFALRTAHRSPVADRRPIEEENGVLPHGVRQRAAGPHVHPIQAATRLANRDGGRSRTAHQFRHRDFIVGPDVFVLGIPRRPGSLHLPVHDPLRLRRELLGRDARHDCRMRRHEETGKQRE